MTPEERAAAIGDALGTKEITYSYLGINFRVGGCVVNGPAVTVTISAWTGAGGNRVDLPTDNPYTFVNPPLGVPTGTTEIVVTRGRVQETVTVATFTRDDLTAAKQMVYDAVTRVARRLGWTP